MVGIQCDSIMSPVSAAHKAIRQPNATVAQALASLSSPPLESIPRLTDPGARPGQWVRYTAMVQDIWDMELFVANSPDGQSGLLLENAAPSTHAAAQLAERLPLYLVSIPGETEWVCAARNNSNQRPAAPRSVPPPQPTQQKLKRTRSDVEMEDAAAPLDVDESAVTAARPPVPARSYTSDKRSKPSNEHVPTPAPVVTAMGLNTPVHNQHAASAVVAKLYDVDGTSPSLNTVMEVVGILQEGVDVSTASDDAFAAELVARNPRNVMRLHIVKWRQVPAWELNPLAARLGEGGVAAARQEVTTVAHGLRDMMIKYLASALMGDVVAAEYLLLALLSRPVRAGDQLLGKLSVNIVLPASVSDEVGARFIRAVKNLCASVIQIDVNIASMNSVEVFARKDYDLNRLKAGCLQLTSGSCLLANETALSHGRLAERGVKNIRALTSVSQRCLSPVDFHYYESEMEVQCCTVLLSKGGKSIIGSDVVVRVCEDSSMKLLEWEAYNADLIGKMRLALTLLAEHGKFDILKEASDEVANAYVEARKQGLAKDGQESLQRWLGVARCCARSFGESVLSAERWRYALELEKTREGRVGGGMSATGQNGTS